MVTQRLNLRFAAYSFLSIVVLCSAVYFVHGYQVRRNATALLHQAERATQKGELDKAAGYFHRYLAFVPFDSDALARYGLILADPRLAKSTRDTFRAIQTLQNALYRDPARNDLRRRIVQLSVDSGLYAAARRDLEEYLIPKDPNDGELALQLAQCLEHSGSYGPARSEYERSIRVAPASLNSYAKLANLLRRHPKETLRNDERSTDAAKLANGIMDTMTAANPTSFQAYLLHADDRQRFGLGDAGAAATIANDIAKARELAPDAAEVIIASVALRMESNEIDAARAELQRGRQLHPNEKRIYKALAQLEYRAGRPDVAISCLREALAKLGEQTDLLWQLAELHIAVGQVEDGKKALARLDAAGAPKYDSDCLRAQLLMNERQWLPAMSLLQVAVPRLVARAAQIDDFFAESQAQRAAMMFGHCCEQLGDFDRAVAAYSRVIARDPMSIAGRIGLANTLASIGRNSEALEQYHQLQRIPGAPLRVHVEIARLLLLRNLDREPNRRDWTEVSRAIDRLDTLTPLPHEAVVYRAELLSAQGKVDEARDYIVKKYADPKSRPAEVSITLSNLEDRLGRGSEAAAVLDEADAQFAHSTALRLARARHNIRQAPASANASISSIAEGLEQFKSEDQVRLLHGLATLAMQCDEPKLATDLWQRAAKINPNDLRCQVGLFDAAVRLQDQDAITAAVKTLREIEGLDGVLWRYARAATLIGKAARGDKSGLAEARTLLSVVSVRRSYWSRVIICQAQLDDLEGNRDDAALAGYMRGLALGDTDPVAYRRAVELLFKQRRFSEAYDLLRRVPADVSRSTDLQRIGAELALYSNDGSEAVRMAEALVANGSKDFRDHLSLGRVYMVVGKVDQAGPSFERARELAPNEPDTWVALVQYLATTGKKDRALAEIEVAKAQLTDGNGLLSLGYCYEAVGKPDQAKIQYEAAVAKQPTDVPTVRGAASFYFRRGQFAAAETLLRRLSTELSTQSPDSARWARDKMAILLAMHGDPKRTGQALALLVEEEAAPNSAANLASIQRTRATVLAMQSGQQARREAVKIIEGLIERRTATPQDHFLVAQLNELLGDWPRAKYRYLSCLELSNTDSAAHLFAVARSMLRHGEAEEARPFVTRFQAGTDPKSLAAIELHARMLHAEGKPSEGIALLQSYAKTDGAKVVSAAEILADLGAFSQAEEIYRAVAAQPGKTSDILALARFLVGRGKVDDTLDVCDRLWSDGPPLIVAEIALEALLSGPPDSRRIEIVDRGLDTLSKRAPAEAGIVAARAAIRNFQGRFDEAEQLYRKALAQDPALEVGLNNLAWLLALRGSAPEAIELLRRAADISGMHAGLLDTRGVAYLALKQTLFVDKAIDDLKNAVADSPNPASYFHLAQAYMAAGRTMDARQSWRTALRTGLNPDVLHPLERPAYHQLAKLLN